MHILLVLWTYWKQCIVQSALRVGKRILNFLQMYQLMNQWCVCAHVCTCARSHVWLSVAAWTIAQQAPLSMEFFRQVYWSGLPSSCPGDLPDPGVELTSFVSPALADGFFTTVPPGKSNIYVYSLNSVAVFQLWSKCEMENKRQCFYKAPTFISNLCIQ